MLPIILGIAASAGTAISAGQAMAIGAGIGAATVAGANLMTNNQKQKRHEGVNNEELEELVERLVQQRLRKIRKKV